MYQEVPELERRLSELQSQIDRLNMSVHLSRDRQDHLRPLETRLFAHSLRAPRGRPDQLDANVVDAGHWVMREQPAVVAKQVIEALKGRGVRRVGLDASVVSSQVAIEVKDTEAIDPELWQMRRQKDPDELKLMRKAIDCTVAMDKRAKEIIEPGVPELKVFTELNQAAVMEAGEPLTELLGNDFRCAARGGAPRGDVAGTGRWWGATVSTPSWWPGGTAHAPGTAAWPWSTARRAPARVD